MSWRDSTIIAPVSIYHRVSYAERYSRYTPMEHAQDENPGVGQPVIDGMAGMFIAGQAGTKEPVIPAYQRGIGEQTETIRQPVMVGIGLCFAEILNGIAVDIHDIGLRLTGQAETHNPMSFLAFSLI